MSEKEIKNNEEPKMSLVEKFKAMKKEDKIMVAVMAVIVIAVVVICISYFAVPAAENQHQAEIRAEVQMPECVHIQEAQATLFTTKENMKANITSGFDEYWKTYEVNFWKEFKKSHETNHPECFAVQNAE